jgi:hypothetical protein
MRAHQQVTSPRWRGLIAMLTLAGTAMTAAACSSAPPQGQVASLPGRSAGTQAPSKLTAAQSDRDMIDFARCMRSHGVQVPDPVHIPGHAGVSIQVPQQSAANRPAYTACIHFIQPIISMKAAGRAAQAAPHLHALTEYARCMRGHDINMLDPNPQGALNLGNVPGITSDFGRYSPQFRAADSACRHFLPAGVHDDGTGP